MLQPASNETGIEIDLGLLKLSTHPAPILFTLAHPGVQAPLCVYQPLLEIDHRVCGAFKALRRVDQRPLPHGGLETRLLFAAQYQAGLELELVLRSFAASPILRMKYHFITRAPLKFTHKPGGGSIVYFRLDQLGLEACGLTDYQISHFDQVAHSYKPNPVSYRPNEVTPGMVMAGPVELFHSPQQTVLMAYEHGADHPDSFLNFMMCEECEERQVILQAGKGNTYEGQPVADWESVWFELGLQLGGLDQFLPVYRRFFLEEVCEDLESRKPYIYYNTWNYQERQKYFNGRPYLESMHAGRILAEIDVAHRLGVDVFVIDTGWYKKTGDWLPDLARFPEGLKEVKRLLDAYGMKLGLWFNPTVSALTSSVFLQHPEWEMTWQGSPRWRGPVWETEESTGMCLASDYASYYVEVMIRLHQELGVSYFKWDGVAQVGCDSPLHNHGGLDNSPEERASVYAYQMGLAMIRIVEEVTRRCPGVIVDFDITEGGRFVGLGFLSAGKYFLVNNGPYFHEFDLPSQVKIDPDTINVFFYPGPARPRVCRTGALFDPLIPSILFLTHYLPDGPRLSQANSLASLALGGNGLWGDLLSLSQDEIQFIGSQVDLYKQVADGVTRAYPRVSGFPGSSPEIHEKIDLQSGSGLVAFFTVSPGKVTYYTQSLNPTRIVEVIGADAWQWVDGGRLKIMVELAQDDARLVYILPKGAG